MLHTWLTIGKKIRTRGLKTTYSGGYLAQAKRIVVNSLMPRQMLVALPPWNGSYKQACYSWLACLAVCHTQTRLPGMEPGESHRFRNQLDWEEQAVGEFWGLPSQHAICTLLFAQIEACCCVWLLQQLSCPQTAGISIATFLKKTQNSSKHKFSLTDLTPVACSGRNWGQTPFSKTRLDEEL